MPGTYSYDPSKLVEKGMDLMRFQLGDTMVEGKEKTCALTDEEYQAVLQTQTNWKKAKLLCIESILRRFSYEVDTTTGPLSLQFGARAKLWQEEYEKLKKELSKSCLSTSAISAQVQGQNKKEPYFYTGMMSGERGSQDVIS